MKNLLFFLLLINNFHLVWAETSLPFPITEAEMVRALTPKPISQRENKGFGMDSKGIKAIRDDSPKMGALILFDFDSAVIKPKSYLLLREFANALQRALSDVQITIRGHTDNIGTETYNFELSQQRAQAVKDFLVSTYSIPANRFITQAYGETQPIESNDTELGRTMNRRVEFVRN